jgi:2-methylcitrate dehydratase PrpD
MMRMTGLANVLAQRCSTDWRAQFDATERTALGGIVRTAFVDTAACMLSGRQEEVMRIATRWVSARFAGEGPSSVVFGARRMGSGGAALVNAVAGHALDYDDVALAGHPSVVLVPALFAEHERSGASGFDLVQAYAKGYAVWGELQRRLKVSLHARGWHPSAVIGVVAAAAAVSALRGLNARQTANALGIAASLAGGVIANFGSMTKPLQIGRAAEGGISAMELALAGMDASPDALDGQTGLLAALAGPGNADLESPCAEDFETTLLRVRPGIKKYPVCYAAHRVVDGVLDLVHRHHLAPADVLRVQATISATTADVLRQHAPATLTQARFSLEFATAAALVYGRLGIAEVSEAALADPAVRALMPCVQTLTVNTSCPLEPSFAYEDRVAVTLRDGSLLDSGPIRFARGHAQLPLDEAQLREKLLSCAGGDGQALASQVLARIDAALRPAS